MGGFIDCGVGVDSKSSPRPVAIEKAQAELRLEFDVREERRKELEFLEKGGNPLDFKLGSATSINVYPLLPEQILDHYAISETKGSFPYISSPNEDSVESSDRPAPLSVKEANTGDNLLLFGGDNPTVDGEKISFHPNKRNTITSDLDESHNVKDLEESAMFRLSVQRQAYTRRNRSRISRALNDAVPSNRGNGTLTLISNHDLRASRGSLCGIRVDKDLSSSTCYSKSSSPKDNVIFENISSNKQLDGAPNSLIFNSAKIQIFDERIESSTSSILQDTKNPHFEGHKANVPESMALDNILTAPIGKNEVKLSENTNFSPHVTQNDKNVDHSNLSNGLQVLRNNGDDLKCETLHSKNTFDIVHIPSLRFEDENITNNPGLTYDRDFKDDASALEISRAPDVSKGEENIQDNKLVVNNVVVNESHKVDHESFNNSSIEVKVEEVCDSIGNIPTDIEHFANVKQIEQNNPCVSESRIKIDNVSVLNSKSPPEASIQHNSDLPNIALPSSSLLMKDSEAASQVQDSKISHIQTENKEWEEVILAEAQVIESNLRRADELSINSFCIEKRQKSHWDFVLEEMQWLANDFIQERLWKAATAAQICYLVSFTGRSKFYEKNLHHRQRHIAHILAKSISQFWLFAEKLLDKTTQLTLEECDLAFSVSAKDDVVPDSETVPDEPNFKKETNNVLEECNNQRYHVHEYAVRLLKFNRTSNHQFEVQAPKTPDRISDKGILDTSHEDRQFREGLLYQVPHGAMANYRNFVEAQWERYQKTGNKVRDDLETSLDSVAEFEDRDNAFEDGEGETGMYCLPEFLELRKSSHFSRKRKISNKLYGSRANFSYGYCLENRMGNQSSFPGKRPSNTLSVGSIPTKRVRTAPRPRIIGPFTMASSGVGLLTNKTEASSGDTSSLQDDQSSLHIGSQVRKTFEVESTGEYNKQLPLDGIEVSPKPKKKKKAKHLGYKGSMYSDSMGLAMSRKGSAYEERWQIESLGLTDQRDLLKKRLESNTYECNGLYGLQAAKKLKIPKQVQDNSPESSAPMTGSIPSPVASQMSNMSNPNKSIRIVSNRDQSKKIKGMKTPAGPLGAGCPWSLFEDQALVVLVHDMGPNWELVSDTINSTLQFKCIFRKPKECKDRHKNLMDRNAGDGADSTEDSGSSQPYPSTLPGIPKGSALHLFQRLKAPMEEDTLKAHFEKIIFLGQQHFHRRRDDQEAKQIIQPHDSHRNALAQACTSSLSGYTPTPLDLCDVTTPSPDVMSLGYQSSHSSSLHIQNHGISVGSPLPNSGVNSLLQASSGMILGSNLVPPTAVPPTPGRESQRYNIPRSASLPIDEHQRMQQYNQMLPSRGIQSSGIPVSGSLPAGTDRGVHVINAGNSMGMMCGTNPGMTIPRPGIQGIASPAMLNMVSSGNMLSAAGVGMTNAVNMHSGTASNQGNSVLRPRDSLPILRPGHNADDQRQIMMQEIQSNLGNGQAVASSFNSSPFNNQTVPSSVPLFPGHHQMSQAPHVIGNPHHPQLQNTNPSSQQTFTYRFAKERHQQLQKRYLHHQHSVPPLQSTSHLQQPTSSQPVTPSSSSMNVQPQPKTHNLPHGLNRNPLVGSNIRNHLMKQRQRQQIQQQQFPGQSQPKLMKGIGRSNVAVHQNLPLDTSQSNNMPASSGNHVVDKGQGLYPIQDSTSVPPGKQFGPQPLNPKTFPHPLPPSPKQRPQTVPCMDNTNPIPTQVQQRQVGSAQQSVQQMVHQNRQSNSDAPLPSPVEPSSGTYQTASSSTTSTIPSCTYSTSSLPLAPCTDPSYDMNAPNMATQEVCSGKMIHSNSSGNESMPLTNQGLQFPGQNGGQWHQQQQSQSKVGTSGPYAPSTTGGPG